MNSRTDESSVGEPVLEDARAPQRLAKVRLRGPASAAVLGLLLAPLPLSAANTELSATIPLLFEYDDNLGLESSREDPGELLLRIRPDFAATLPFSGHEASLAVGADYRYALESGASELNLDATAALHLEFSGGLSFHLSDEYEKSGFDQDLDFELGAPDSDSNELNVGLGYVFVERLRGEASYTLQAQTYDEDDGSRVRRDVDSFSGKLYVPLTRAAVSYLLVDGSQQRSPERPDRDYSEEAYRLGVEWKGRSRVTLRFEAGWSALDFDLRPEEYEDDVIELGVLVDVSELIDGEIVVGRDRFGRFGYSGRLSYRTDRGLALGLEAGREVESSFSFVFDSTLVQTTHVDLSLRNTLFDRFEVHLTGGYQLQDSVFSDEERDDELLSATFAVDYPLSESFLLGLSYQYSQRRSNAPEYDFDNNRIGLVSTWRLW